MSDQDPPMDVQPTDAAAGAPGDYQLSRIIAAHTNDIKCLTSTVSGAIISGSRDEKVKLFVERGGTFIESLCLNNRMAVNAVAFLVCTDGSSLIFCGRKDGTVAVYKDGEAEPRDVLHAHSANVCVLQVSDEFRQLITGSWDHASMVYDLNELIAGRNPELFKLSGHKNSIWAAAFIPKKPNFFLTGSADRTINLWAGPEAVRTYAGHSDVVRGLLALDGDFFVSTANDSTLRVWDTKSGSSTEYASSTGEYIYSISSVQLPDGRTLVANCGEQGIIEIWELDVAERTLRPLQAIRTPATSLWAVRALPGGDLAVGASNGYVYVFSPHADRLASADQREVFEANVQAMLQAMAEAKSKNQGDVVTIKVGLDDGAPKLDLKYKKGTDPVAAAMQFIEENNLPISYMHEIAEFIKMNVVEARNFAAGGEPPVAAADPFTGGGRYVPAPPESGGQFGADPFTGGNRYVPGGAAAGPEALVPKSLAPNDKKRPRSELVPLRAYYSFGYESVAQKAQETLKHANAQLESDVMLEEPLLDSLFEILANEKFEATEIHLLALEKGFMQWPMEMMVPLLDVFRLAVLNPQINEYFCSNKDGNRAAATMHRLSSLLISDPPLPVRILVCRSLANAAAHEDGRQMLQQELSSVSELIVAQLVAENQKPALQLAATSALANIALVLLRQTEKCQELGPREDVLRAIIKSTESVHSFGGLTEPALVRLLQAIVTLMWGDPAVITLAKQRGICEIVNRIKDAVQSDESKNIARDIFVMTTAV
ncbi:hypothetical protein M3Y99_01527700 [Aphelenchoides fujianensis]|nr:hypothetical protein M3Y99_01527700 [Aphelenchoides fujianensis]